MKSPQQLPRQLVCNSTLQAMNKHQLYFLCALLLCADACAEHWPQTARQWRPVDFSFEAKTEIADPFDFERSQFHAVFRGPGGETFTLPGFWDGGQTWKIRFTPTKPGAWIYVTKFRDTSDKGLHGQRGTLQVQAATGSADVHRHGGFLKVSANRRHLTFTDGKPFFWLGDTWWPTPSEAVQFDIFKRMVDTRVAQGYTVFQAHGHRPLFAGSSIGAFEATRKPDAETLRYWHETDRYFAYAEEKGVVGMMGFARGDLFDPFSLPELKRLWHYYMARYGAYPMGILITQEYNIDPDKRQAHLPRLLALGQFIKDIDPHHRAMTAHPWVHSRDLRQAWNEPWLDFIMLQAGHRRFAPAKFYHELYQRPTPKPFIEAEANYEGFISTNFVTNAAAVRRAAYTAMQSGSFGFTYGAQGLYAGILNRAKPGPTARWGPVLTWEEGLALPGGIQLQHMRAFYESVEWWKLEPRANAVEPACDVLVKADGADTLLLYFVSKAKSPAVTHLKGLPQSAHYEATWFIAQRQLFFPTDDN